MGIVYLGTRPWAISDASIWTPRTAPCSSWGPHRNRISGGRHRRTTRSPRPELPGVVFAARSCSTWWMRTQEDGERRRGSMLDNGAYQAYIYIGAYIHMYIYIMEYESKAELCLASTVQYLRLQIWLVVECCLYPYWLYWQDGWFWWMPFLICTYNQQQRIRNTTAPFKCIFFTL